MEQLVDRISHLQVAHLGTREFQAAVLGALGELMKEQESLRATLDLLAKADERDDDMEELERLISDDSSNDEADINGMNIIFETHGIIFFFREIHKNTEICLPWRTKFKTICWSSETCSPVSL